MDQLHVNDAVAAALHQGRPVVALESTIITHGMPYPDNLETARDVEQAIREKGAVPATIAVLDGKLTVGLSDPELETLARLGTKAAKCSRRDLPILVHRRQTGATTVAATMIIAAMAGIRVFATGGIGGVHRGAGRTMDISADLQELARTSVAVVCAGPKAILDIGLTAEYLETMGVPVIGFGTDCLPAFYTRDSGLGVDCRADSAKDVAGILRSKWGLGLAGGVVVANPVPEAFVLDPATIENAVQQALGQAADQGISGKDLTPFLLAAVEEATGGNSLQSNIALVLNNARLGADIAVALAGDTAPLPAS
ncbi:MAG: pseudouridine-5'-phosphate glycosidase [Xanthomonadales bacterium]|nr:pseudouridine-5'-phosphate glycosidase [Xanthomonadales bacterium]